ncbi:MAG: hypothetical protein R3C25_09175 [Hyphomonadaceae bacterium]
MRQLLLPLALLFTLPAAAQTPAPTPEILRAEIALGALWRPVEAPLTAQSIRQACTGAEEEIAALDAAVPLELDVESAARVRGLRGLHIIPLGGAPGAAYFFPPLGMDWFTSGLGSFSVISESDGFIGVRDANGREIALQLGRAGAHAMMRLRAPDGQILSLASCQPIAPIEGSRPSSG